MAVADRVYARALYDAALDAGAVQDVQAELGRAAGALAELPELRSAVGNPQLDAESKAVLLQAAAGEPSDLTANFLRLVAEKGRAGSVEAISAEYERIVARAEGQLTVELTTAHELSDADAKSIVAQIEKASGRKVEAVRKVDPSIIGGIVLQAGSLRADASVKGRLTRMRHELLTRTR